MPAGNIGEVNQMTLFRRTSIVCTFAAFLLLALGGVVRATKSGLGCGTDWPDCLGRLTPSVANQAMVIEYSHRALAGVVMLALAALAFIAFRNHRDRPRILWPAVGAFGLGLFQAALGAVVVKLELEAQTVVLHLAAALGMLALLVYLTSAAFISEKKLPGPSDGPLARQAMLAAASVLVVLLVGSYLTGIGEAQNAGFPSWPLISGRLVPDLSVEITALHWLHRILAALVGIIVIVVSLRVIRRKQEMRVASRLAHSAGGLYVVELLIGAANVWTQSNEAVNSAFIAIHLALGALVWTALVGIAVVAHPAMRRLARGETLHVGRPSLEGEPWVAVRRS